MDSVAAIPGTGHGPLMLAQTGLRAILAAVALVALPRVAVSARPTS